MASKNKSTKTCPTCGAQSSRNRKICPSCGEAFPKPEKKQGSDSSKSSRSSRIKCPSCGAMVSAKLKDCPSCGNPVVQEPQEAAVTPVVEQTGVGEGQAPEPEIPQEQAAPDEMPASPETEAPHELPQTVSAVVGEDTQSCPKCASKIPLSFTKCPVCAADMTETPPEPVHEVPPAAEKAPAAMEPRVSRPVRKRKLKQAGSKAVPARSMETPVGRTNGVSYGREVGKAGSAGLVNGTGAINGNSFVNGTGAPVASGGRPETRTARKSLLFRWQFLAVLVAIIIIIPTFVYISYSDNGGGLSIDGDFGDWSDATTYGTRFYSTSPSSNITEWAVADDVSGLYLYIETEAGMMSSPDATSYYLFVDSDGASETGFVMESIGADYLLRITGWDSGINSTSLSWYNSPVDQYDWNSWLWMESLSCTMEGDRLEAKARIPEAIEDSARFVIVSKDATDKGSASFPTPMSGGMLIVEQQVPTSITSTGVVAKASLTTVLNLRFSCQGEGGCVSVVNPELNGATAVGPTQGFYLEKGKHYDTAISVNTSAAADGQLISAEITESSIVSNFTEVVVVGSGLKAHAATAPTSIVIDGAFGDWSGLLSTDYDAIPVNDANLDLHQIGSASAGLGSYFYVSVSGEMCAGTFVPAKVAKPSGTGGGGGVVYPRHTAEDILNIYVDTDKSIGTGQLVELAPKSIGADVKIEIRGLFGAITVMSEFDYVSSTGLWEETLDVVKAAKDEKRIEIGVSAASLAGASDIDYIIETTSWEGRADLAAFDPYSASMLTRTWVVDPATTSASATSLSLQRKMFFDGTNHWSFYFDGKDTVHKYSTDFGVTWSAPTRAFVSLGVNKVSVWYDSRASVVYAVGDSSAATSMVAVQRGVVDSANHSIAWNPSDEFLSTSTVAQGDKNAFISKDASGYVWVLGLNNTGVNPKRQDLSAFRSDLPDNLKAWLHTGNLLGTGNNQPSIKGSVLPTGNGSEMFAIYTYMGNVASRKFTSAWTSENIIYTVGASAANTDNSPPSAVVDSKGVVHVVYGTGRKVGPNSAPTIEYSHSVTDQATFTPGVDIDPSIPQKSGDFFPTITIDSSSDNLYVLWLQSDDTLVPKTVIGRACVSGTWSTFTIEGQTTYMKQYLTSIYSVESGQVLCWQWTQNATAPMQVIFDTAPIPEFSDFILPFFGLSVTMIAVFSGRSRARDDLSE